MPEILWPLGPSHGGIRVIVTRHLAERRERETFSGGVNLSARYRNALALKREMDRLFFMKPNGPLYCAPAVFRLLREELNDPTNDEPSIEAVAHRAKRRLEYETMAHEWIVLRHKIDAALGRSGADVSLTKEDSDADNS